MTTRCPVVTLWLSIFVGLTPGTAPLASIMAPATPFCFWTTQKHLTVKNNNWLKNLGNYSEWPKVAGAVIEAAPLTCQALLWLAMFLYILGLLVPHLVLLQVRKTSCAFQRQQR
jgi:hypothetical protein